jgi:hypothetical protein
MRSMISAGARAASARKANASTAVELLATVRRREEISWGRRGTQMNTDKNLVFNLRSSVFLGGHSSFTRSEGAVVMAL